MVAEAYHGIAVRGILLAITMQAELPEQFQERNSDEDDE
jgi:hypothetical protein